MKKGRSSFLLGIELLVLVLIFAAVLGSTGSAQIKTLYYQREYPREYIEYVRKYSIIYDMDENIIFSVIKAESKFDPDAVSPSGAIGLMQIMPSTYDGEICPELGLEPGADALFDPETNIKCGIYYLSKLYRHFGERLAEASAAYNAGIGRVSEWLEDTRYSSGNELLLNRIPYTETRVYVSRVLYYLGEYEKAYGDYRRPTSRMEKDEALVYAKRYGDAFAVDYNLVMAVIEVESHFDTLALSSSDAVGLMQIKASTYEGDIKSNLGMVENATYLYDGEFNIKCGAYYLHWLDERLDGLEQIAAAYHGGIGNVRGWLSNQAYSTDGKTLIHDSIPDEATKRYVMKILESYERAVAENGADPYYSLR